MPCPIVLDVGLVQGRRSHRKHCSKPYGHDGAHIVGGYVVFYARPEDNEIRVAGRR